MEEKPRIEEEPKMEDQGGNGKLLVKRDPLGRFLKGNQEGVKFGKGNIAGRKRGSKNKKTVIAFEFARDCLGLDPETGKMMTYKELLIWIKKQAERSPRILVLLLEYYLGKPKDTIDQTVRIVRIDLGNELKEDEGGVEEDQGDLTDDDDI